MVALEDRSIADRPLQVDEVQGSFGPLFRVSRGVVLLILGLIYAGGIQFFNVISPALLNGTYLAIVTCVGGCLLLDWSPSRNFRSIGLYLIWLFCCFLWGMIVMGDGAVFEEGAKYYIKNVIVIGALAFAIDRGTLRTFVRVVQFGVLGNFALCVWETFDPELVRELSLTRDPNATAFNVLRPAGLWINPDEAAFAFVFALILLRWSSGTLTWLARMASIAGIILSASRTGVYVLLLCGLVQAWIWTKRRGISASLVAGLCVGSLVLSATLFLLVRQPWFTLSDESQLHRIFDFKEHTRDVDAASRVEIAMAAVRAAIDGPWYGSGLFTFQYEWGLPTVLDTPAHNIFLVVFGEAGLLVGISYLVVLGIGVWRTLYMPLRAHDQIAILLMWASYFLISVTWHNQFTSFSGMIYIGLLWHLPTVLRLESRCVEIKGHV